MRTWQTALVYGGAAACALAVVKLSEVGLAARTSLVDLYIAIPSAIFLGLGLWFGLRSRAKPPAPIVILPPTNSEPSPTAIAHSGLSPRELEVLQRAAKGMSNQEIANDLFISLSTVKTHLNNVFIKLDVKRRTQAVSKAKALHLIS